MLSFDQATAPIMLLYGFASCIGIAGMLMRSILLKRTACIAAVLAFCVQTLTLLLGSHAITPGGLSWGAYLQMMAWFLVLCGMGAWWKFKMDTPLIFASPLALIFFILSWRYLHFQVRLPASISGSFYALHIGTLFLSLGLMALACMAGILFVYLDTKIKAKSPIFGFRQDFPALSLLDKINTFTVYVGFPLYTIGMLAGFIWASSAWGSTVTGDPKEIVSLVVWIIYAYLFHMRLVQGRRGRRPALLAITLFVLCAFSFFYVNSFMNTHHSFIKQP